MCIQILSETDARKYASTVWSPGQKLLSSSIEKIQRRAARYVSGNYKRTDNVTAMVDDLKWDTREERRKKNRVIMLQKIRTGLVAIPPTKLIPATKRCYPQSWCTWPTFTILNTLSVLWISQNLNWYMFSCSNKLTDAQWTIVRLTSSLTIMRHSKLSAMTAIVRWWWWWWNRNGNGSSW